MIAPPIPQTTPMMVFLELDERPELELLLSELLKLAAVDEAEAAAEVAAVFVDSAVET